MLKFSYGGKFKCNSTRHFLWKNLEHNKYVNSYKIVYRHYMWVRRENAHLLRYNEWWSSHIVGLRRLVESITTPHTVDIISERHMGGLLSVIYNKHVFTMLSIFFLCVEAFFLPMNIAGYIFRCTLL